MITAVSLLLSAERVAVARQRAYRGDMVPSITRISVVAAPLYREELGAHLRDLRHERGERLADTASRAGVSTQYLSEIERGRKDPSSEIVEAVSLALGTTVGDVAVAVGQRLRQIAPAQQSGLHARAFALAA